MMVPAVSTFCVTFCRISHVWEDTHCTGYGYSTLCMLLCFQITVYSVKKRPNFSTSGQWEVVTECEGKKEVNIFDGVMLCTGHHTKAHLPLESFPGE